jgi:hypothetical protein
LRPAFEHEIFFSEYKRWQKRFAADFNDFILRLYDRKQKLFSMLAGWSSSTLWGELTQFAVKAQYPTDILLGSRRMPFQIKIALLSAMARKSCNFVADDFVWDLAR